MFQTMVDKPSSKPMIYVADARVTSSRWIEWYKTKRVYLYIYIYTRLHQV